jgi:hypothetical protein
LQQHGDERGIKFFFLELGKNLSPSKLRRYHDSCEFGKASGKESREVFVFTVSENFANLLLSGERIAEKVLVRKTV